MHTSGKGGLLVALIGTMLAGCGSGDTGAGPTAQPKALATTVNTLAACAEWNSTQIYTVGNCVTYQSKVYEAKWWTQGNVPGTEEWGPWKLTTVTPTPTPTPTPAPLPTPTRTPAPKCLTSLDHPAQRAADSESGIPLPRDRS